MEVLHALQGHPEAAHLWDRHIDQILRNHDFQPTTHEPCLYHSTKEQTYALLLRQVDDFAIAVEHEDITTNIIKAIDKK